MKIAIFPGSFNPWHEGHEDVLIKALKVFDKVVIVRATNSSKEPSSSMEFPYHLTGDSRIEILEFNGLLRDLVSGSGYSAIIKGIRNIQDFEYEKIQQYINEDLGISLPTLYIFSDRSLVHKSSTVVRALKKYGCK